MVSPYRLLMTPAEVLEAAQHAETKGTKLGSGQFGDVYVVLQPRTIALKRLRDPQHFHQEVQPFKVLQQQQPYCPHIVTLLASARPYVAFEFCCNGSLDQRAPTSWADLLRVVAQVAAAVQYAHERKILHRDIKPANVLLDEHHNARLADWGMAVHMPAGYDCANVQGSDGQPLLGDLEYSDPGVQRDGLYRPASDVYSFGCMLRKLLERHKHTWVIPDCQKSGVLKLADECCDVNWASRPLISTVLQRLEDIRSTW